MCPLSKLDDQLSGMLAQVQDRSVRSSALLRALTVEVASSRDQLRDYILHHPDTQSAVLSILPSLAPQGIPSPPADAPSPKSPESNYRSEAPDASGTDIQPSGAGLPATEGADNEPVRVDASLQQDEKRGQKRNRSSSTNSAKAPDTRYTSAEVAASRVLNEAFEPAALAQLRRSLVRKRRQNPLKVDDLEQSVMCSLSETSSDQDVVKHLRGLRNLADAVTGQGDFSVFTKRFWFARYVKLFKQMTSRKSSREKSLAVLFVDITMAEWVSCKEGLKEKKVDKQFRKEIEEKRKKAKAGEKVEEVTAEERAARVRSKLRKAKTEEWKKVVAQHTLWFQIIDEFGCAALAMIDRRMYNTHVGNLTIEKRQKLLADIAVKYPNLKEDTKELSGLLESVAMFNVLPPKRLILETMSKPQLAATKKSLRELLEIDSSEQFQTHSAVSIHQDINGGPQWAMAEQNSPGDRILSSFAVDLLPENHSADGNKLSGSTATNEYAFNTLVQYGMQQTIDPSLLDQTVQEG